MEARQGWISSRSDVLILCPCRRNQKAGSAAREMDSLVGLAAKFTLDLDDAYQYSAAIWHWLKIGSFDADFDRTTERRLLPTDVL